VFLNYRPERELKDDERERRVEEGEGGGNDG